MHKHAHLGRKRSKPQVNFGLYPQALFDSLDGALVIGYRTSSATDWSGTTRSDVFLPSQSVDSLSYFASLEFRLSHTGFPLVRLGLETCLQVRNELSQTRSGPATKTDPQNSYRPGMSEFAFHNTRHIHRHRHRPSLHLQCHIC